MFTRRHSGQPLLQRTRVQYGAISRRQLLRDTFDAEPPAASADVVGHQALMGLGIVTVAAYVMGLAIGGIQPANVVTDSPVEQRTQNVVEALRAHPTDSLVGEFWRILPASGASDTTAALVPLTSCTKPALTQFTPGQHYQRHSFAYLLSLDASDPALAHCTVEDLISVYGRPSAITITAGTVEHPQEEVLFYNHGAHRSRPVRPVLVSASDQSSSAVRPVDVQNLSNTDCPGHTTVLQVVAHEDDDLLFMNPDLLHALQQGDCVRTVYLTAGDAGSSKYYWLGRERGSEAAYALLSGLADEWTEQTVKLGTNRFVTLASPAGNTHISLIFAHLPDGKPDGQGFQNSSFESIAKLVSGEKLTIQSVDAQSLYTKTGLINSLTALMNAYQPAEIRTQRPYNDSVHFSDHSDHLTAGQVATSAYKVYRLKHSQAKLSYYSGYPIREWPVNVDGNDLQLKEQAFFTYANYDGAVCGTVDLCMSRGDYGDYLQRQYHTEP